MQHTYYANGTRTARICPKLEALIGRPDPGQTGQENYLTGLDLEIPEITVLKMAPPLQSP